MYLTFFAVINCNRCLYKQHWCFTDHSALYRPKKLVKHLSTAILLQFRFHLFGFCTCANIKRVPGYKETDPNVQFMDNYPDNRVSVPSLVFKGCHWSISPLSYVHFVRSLVHYLMSTFLFIGPLVHCLF